jgi:hypothetical protein
VATPEPRPQVYLTTDVYWHLQLILSMRTTGAHEDRTTPSGLQRLSMIVHASGFAPMLL